MRRMTPLLVAALLLTGLAATGLGSAASGDVEQQLFRSAHLQRRRRGDDAAAGLAPLADRG